MDAYKVNDQDVVQHNNRDIINHNLVDAELKHEQSRARMQLNMENVIFVAIDSNEMVTLINRKGCEILGRS